MMPPRLVHPAYRPGGTPQVCDGTPFDVGWAIDVLYRSSAG
jgi:hypothetical protein